MPILKAGLAHKGFAFVDVISPCVTFNDHEGSTKSYAYTREHNVEVVQADFVRPHDEITVEIPDGDVKNVMLHDGGWVRLRKVAADYDATDRDRAYAYIRERQRAGEVVTGLLYISRRLAGHARSERDDRPGAHRGPLRAPLARTRGARRAAGRIQVGRFAASRLQVRAASPRCRFAAPEFVDGAALGRAPFGARRTTRDFRSREPNGERALRRAQRRSREPAAATAAERCSRGEAANCSLPSAAGAGAAEAREVGREGIVELLFARAERLLERLIQGPACADLRIDDAQ